MAGCVLTRRERHGGGARTRQEEEGRSGAPGLDRPKQGQEFPRRADHHHRVTVQDEVVVRLARCQVGAVHARDLDRHSPYIPVLVRLRGRAGESNARLVGRGAGEQPDTKRGRQPVRDRELRGHAAGRAPLVEARDRAGRMALRAHLFEKRNEFGRQRGFIWRNGLFGKPWGM
jgi:hypothetical protein